MDHKILLMSITSLPLEMRIKIYKYVLFDPNKPYLVQGAKLRNAIPSPKWCYHLYDPKLVPLKSMPRQAIGAGCVRDYYKTLSLSEAFNFKCFTESLERVDSASLVLEDFQLWFWEVIVLNMVSRNQLGGSLVQLARGLEFHFHRITHVSLSILEGPVWTSTFVSWSELRGFCGFVNDYLPKVKSIILLINITEADLRKVMASGQNIEWVAAVHNLVVKERFEAKLHFVEATLPESSVASAEEALIKLIMPLCLRQPSMARDDHVEKYGER